MAHNTIGIGHYVASSQAEGVRFLCDAPELERHADKPWLRAYAAERLDIPPEAMEGSGCSVWDGAGGPRPSGPSCLRLRSHRQRQDAPSLAPSSRADQGGLLGGHARPQD